MEDEVNYDEAGRRVKGNLTTGEKKNWSTASKNFTVKVLRLPYFISKDERRYKCLHFSR